MDIKEAIDGLRTALQTELNGYQFYRIAAEKTADKKAKKVFENLADDEKEHFKEIRKHYNALIKENRWADSLHLPDIEKLYSGESPIFSEEFKSRIKDKHFEMSALSIGALLETNSIELYRKMKEKSENEIARRLFERLIKWEQKHLDAITAQLNLVKEQYWAEQHFAPLF